MVGKLGLIAFSLGLGVVIATPASACPGTFAYRSVVANNAPEHIPNGAVMLKVRVDDALYSAASQEIQGLRASTVERSSKIPAGSKIEIRQELGNMCNTWIEIWSDDHVVTEGILTGFVTGYARRQPDGTYVMTPLLFQRFKDRDWSNGPESQSRGKVPDGRATPVDSNAKWVPLRINAKALARNLDETNAAIRRNLDETEQGKQTPPSGLPSQH